jgi:hypothetical protein
MVVVSHELYTQTDDSCQYISYDMVVDSYELYTQTDEVYFVLLHVPV